MISARVSSEFIASEEEHIKSGFAKFEINEVKFSLFLNSFTDYRIVLDMLDQSYNYGCNSTIKDIKLKIDKMKDSL